jgi:hypothetical protein
MIQSILSFTASASSSVSAIRSTFTALLLSVAFITGLSSCMDDPIAGYEAEPRPIYRPTRVGFTFLEYTPGAQRSSLKVYWDPSPSDTQLNFQGYVVRLLGTDTTKIGNTTAITTFPIQQKIVDKSVFEARFDDVEVGKDYVVAVWGQRFSENDSLVLSRDSMARELNFDPRPVSNPTVIRAISSGSSQITINFDVPADNRQGNVLGYLVYYRDPSRLNDSNRYLASLLPVNDTTTLFPVLNLPTPSGQGISPLKEYEFWIKVVRKDSAQSYGDSTLMRWSGAESAPFSTLNGQQPGIALGSVLGVGNVQGMYAYLQVDEANSLAWIRVEDAGTDIRLTGINGATLASRIDDVAQQHTPLFTRALDPSEFSEASILVPKIATKGGWMVYARKPDGSLIRVFIPKQEETSIVKDNRINPLVMYQPVIRAEEAPLPYF